MIEAILVATVAVCYAELVSILSMCVSVLFGSVWGMVALAHALVLVVFIGGVRLHGLGEAEDEQPAGQRGEHSRLPWPSLAW